jgi:hypothetical protein
MTRHYYGKVGLPTLNTNDVNKRGNKELAAYITFVNIMKSPSAATANPIPMSRAIIPTAKSPLVNIN